MPLPTTTYGSINNDAAGGSCEEGAMLLQPGTTINRSSSTKKMAGLSVACLLFVVLGFFAHSSGTTTRENASVYSNDLMMATSARTNSEEQQQPLMIPYEAVDRAEYGSMAANKIVDPQLFDPSLRGSSSGGAGLLTVPFPTGAFWTNLVLLQQTSDRGLSYPIMVYPYAYKWSGDLLQISYPPLRRMEDEISIRDIFNPDLTVSMKETTTTHRHVMKWDPLSVTLRYYDDSSSSDSSSSSDDDDKDDRRHWETYLVQGSPYITLAYKHVTPVIRPLSIFTSFTCFSSDDDHCSVVSDEDDTTTTVTLKGTQFLLRTQEGLTWMMFASETTTLSFDSIRKTTVTTTKPFSGVLRLALVPPLSQQQDGESSSSSSSSATQQQLACHANTYPVGAKVTWESEEEDVATVHFNFKTKRMNKNTLQEGCENDELLMLALPHHAQVLPSNQMVMDSNLTAAAASFRTIKGAMVPVLGDTWSYQEPLTTIGFESDSSLQNAANLTDDTRKTILDQVQKDMYVVLPTLDENVYGFGKQVARLAQLAHIASVLVDDDDEEEQSSSLAAEISQSLYKYLSAYLTGKNEDKLLFDVNFGGIVSKDGLEDSAGDFGNGWYNDHLFHYGYILYASAVLGKLNATFVQEHGKAVDALLFDVTYSGNADSTTDDASSSYFLPFARHKSWYDSHSFASGLFPFADGKSMESSAESVNCYYGSYLWSLVRWGVDSASPKQDEVDFARLLLAMEIRGVKTYWHMVEEERDTFHVSNIYNSKFSKSLMVGNVGMMDVTIATWFGTNPLYVHMINFLPITAISRVLFEKSYIEEEFKKIIKPVYDTVEMAWKGYVICDRAMVDPNSAWDDALKLRSYELDQAISQSQVLYFTSTTDGFVAHASASSETASTSTADNDGDAQQTSAAFCSEHKACLELGLVGNCCPAPDGTNLGCCGVVVISDTTTTTSQASSLKPLCAENKACADLGLTGNCCPSDGGASLGCCDS